MSTDQVLVGVGLIVVLAVGSQVLASQLHIPALIILLPAGFAVGALTTDVNPQRWCSTLCSGAPVAGSATRWASSCYPSAVLLLTGEDHYNALAAMTLAGSFDMPVYRLAPGHDAATPGMAGELLFAPTLTYLSLTARYTAGDRIITQPADGGIPAATDLLFLISPEGSLIPVTTSGPPAPQPGDILVLLGPRGNGTPQ